MTANPTPIGYILGRITRADPNDKPTEIEGELIHSVDEFHADWDTELHPTPSAAAAALDDPGGHPPPETRVYAVHEIPT